MSLTRPAPLGPLRALLLALGVIGCTRSEPPPPEPVVDQPARRAPAARRALLVGVADYADPGIPDLAGGLNDVDSMKALLVDRFGFTADDIVALVGPAATKAAILRSFRSHLIEGAGRDTVAVFYFSGHGRLVADRDGDESDRYDESIVPYDGRSGFSGDGGDLIDDELAPLVQQLTGRGALATLIFDSCHSGTPVRGEVGGRGLPPIGAVTTRGQAHDQPASDGTTVDGQGGFVVVSATTSQRRAKEVRARDGRVHGALTWALERTLRRAPTAITWRAAIGAIRHRVALNLVGQVPQVDGDRLDRAVFGLDEWPPPPSSFAVRPLSTGADAPRGRVELAGGAVHGIAPGSLFDLVLPGEAGRKAGQVQVVSVSAAQAIAERLGEGALPLGARAVEIARGAPTARLPVAVVGDGAWAERLRTMIAGWPGFEVAPPDVAALRVEVDGAMARLLGPDGAVRGEAVELERPAAAGVVVERLLGWARWHRLRTLESADDFDVDLRFDPAPVDGVLRLPVGAKVAVRAHNRDGRTVHLTLLDLTEDGEIGVAWPMPGQERALPRSPEPFTLLEIKGVEPGRDLLKLLITTRPADFSALQQAPVRNRPPPGHPLMQWFTAAERGDAAPLPAIPTTDWAVRTLRLEVVPAPAEPR